jgi:hypothetical protein
MPSPASGVHWKVAALVGIVVVLAVPAVALTCSDEAVQARGEPSRFESIAKLKARGNWRAHVRAHPKFGPAYANWSIAAAADYTCAAGKDGTACTAVARPCRE